MRIAVQALILKIVLLQQLIAFSACAEQDCTSPFVVVMTPFPRYERDSTIHNSQGQLKEIHEYSRSYHMENAMKSANEYWINKADFYLTSVISVFHNKMSSELSRITTSMWIKVFVFLSVRVFCKSTISSELQLLSLIFVQIDSSLAVQTPSSIMTSSGHVVQSKYFDRGECDLGWYQFGLYCYMPADELKTFDHAQRACVYHDANLVSISNQQENNIAFNISRHFFGFPQSQFVWIGMERRKTTKALHWIDGIHLNYNNWILGEPDSNGACVQMIQDGLWEDTNCYQKMPFICKKQSSYPAAYSRSTELGIMVGIPFIFVLIVLTCVAILLFRSIRSADDTIVGYGKRRNKDKMHAAMINISSTIAHVSSEPQDDRQVTSTPRKASRNNSRTQSVSSSHVNPAIEISDFDSQSPIPMRQEDAEIERNSQETESKTRAPVQPRPRQMAPRDTPPLRSAERGIDRRNDDRTRPPPPLRSVEREIDRRNDNRPRAPPPLRSTERGIDRRNDNRPRAPPPLRSAERGIDRRNDDRPRAPPPLRSVERGIEKRNDDRPRVPPPLRSVERGIDRRNDDRSRAPPPLRSVERGIDRRNNNRLSSDVEEIEMQECVVRSTTSIDKEHPSELATSLDQLVTLKPKSRKLKGMRKPEATVRPSGKEGMYRVKTYV